MPGVQCAEIEAVTAVVAWALQALVAFCFLLDCVQCDSGYLNRPPEWTRTKPVFSSEASSTEPIYWWAAETVWQLRP